MAKNKKTKNYIPLRPIFICNREIMPNESSTFKNVPVYQRDVDNPS